jgi:hypothetical protein
LLMQKPCLPSHATSATLLCNICVTNFAYRMALLFLPITAQHKKGTFNHA